MDLRSLDGSVAEMNAQVAARVGWKSRIARNDRRDKTTSAVVDESSDGGSFLIRRP